MFETKIERIKCNLSWPEIKSKTNFQAHKFYMIQHQKKYEKDYTYFGNKQIDFQKYIDIEKEENTNFFRKYDEKEFINSYFDKKYFNLEDENFKFIKDLYGLDYAKIAVQNLKPGFCIGAHYDATTDYHKELESALTNYSEIPVDQVFNIYIMFLEPWIHGQAFMIGRDCYTQWKPGDVIGFPWYMIHSTVNASRKNRNILYTVGAKIQ